MVTSTSTPPRIRPVGSRLCATKVQLVNCLRKKVEKNKSSFIETKNVYECDPWLLVHEPNPLFKKNEWYYFVQRTKGGGTRAKRTVPRNGENEGGTWKTTGKRIDIEDEKKKVVVGYKQSLVYNKNVNGDKVKTNWLMTEYSLNKGGNKKEFQELVLCWLRKKKTKEEKILVNPGDANENMMMVEGYHGDTTQHQQEEDPPMMVMHNDNNSVMTMTMSNQQEAGFANDEIEKMMMLEGEYEQQKGQGRLSFLLPPPLSLPHQADEDSILMMSDEDFYQWGYLNAEENGIISIGDVPQQQEQR